jgi:predicted adenylyl cyclase CyaB
VNIELKARATDPGRQRRIARQLAGAPGEMLIQTDTFFRAPNGRLKIRELPDGSGELIHYQRADETGPRLSRYTRHETHDVATLKQALADALGVRGVLRKKRRLFLVGQTRIHVDEVPRLGTFVELEVVLKSGQSGAEAVAVARDLMTRLGIRGEDLVAEAYIDLLEQAG